MQKSSFCVKCCDAKPFSSLQASVVMSGSGTTKQNQFLDLCCALVLGESSGVRPFQLQITAIRDEHAHPRFTLQTWMLLPLSAVSPTTRGLYELNVEIFCSNQYNSCVFFIHHPEQIWSDAQSARIISRIQIHYLFYIRIIYI